MIILEEEEQERTTGFDDDFIAGTDDEEFILFFSTSKFSFIFSACFLTVSVIGENNFDVLSKKFNSVNRLSIDFAFKFSRTLFNYFKYSSASRRYL